MIEHKAVADSFCQAGVRGDLLSFGEYLDQDFTVIAPNYLPWGGTHRGAAHYLDILSG